MKIGKTLFFMPILGMSLTLIGSQSTRLRQEALERFRAKYGTTSTGAGDLATNDMPVKKETTQSSMAGDLVINTMPVKKETQGSVAGDLETIAMKKETAQTGKQLQDQSSNIAIDKLDKEIDTQENKEELAEIEDEVKKVKKTPKKVEEAPGLLKSIFGLPKLWLRINSFNNKAAENIKRFNTTFNNVGASLASLDEDNILMPVKKQNGSYDRDKDDKSIIWKEVSALKVTNEMIAQLKNECQYIIIKEMVDGFKHLQPVIGPVLDAFYYLAPKLASQSRLIYDVASQFLPMLEELSKQNLSQK